MRFVLSLVIALGLSLTVGGLLSFIFGLTLKDTIYVRLGLGSFDGVWASADYCFLGALLASIGSGLIVFGGLNWSPRGGK